MATVRTDQELLPVSFPLDPNMARLNNAAIPNRARLLHTYNMAIVEPVLPIKR
jgi:hypothetical protein